MVFLKKTLWRKTRHLHLTSFQHYTALKEKKRKEKKKPDRNGTLAKDDVDARVWGVTSVYAYGCPQSRVDVGLSFPRLENEEERCAGRSLQDNFVHE